jgi:hypothetical protein
MNCGKAVIATTAVGCACDKTNNGINGFIFPGKDSGALYASLKAVLLSCDSRSHGRGIEKSDRS